MSPGSWIVLLPLLFGPARSIEPITTGLAIAAAAGIYQYYPDLKCYAMNCCGEEKTFSADALESDLEKKLFGQHLAHDMVLRTVTGFMRHANPGKPLALSFHGWTGIGKNFITSIIADNLYTPGMDSKSVHLFISMLHFPHASQIALYKDQLKSWIQGNVSRCDRSMFVFDEVDKLHPGILDVLKPFMDYNANIGGVSYRKAIFIFLSNAGGELITRKLLEFWRAGKKREDLRLADVESELSVELFNKEGGFFHCNLISKNLIDLYVPFLPLEFTHVKRCVQAELDKRGVIGNNEDLATEVARELDYFPKEEKIFSVKGCKGLSTKVDIYI
uniref:Torsin n=1 Tax=Leptobrachium leishanense TaxID=445787 RepID=A0A8C5R936_9ANUR